MVLHCKSGVRSAEALAALKGAGYADAIHVGGGMVAWVNQIDPSQPSYYDVRRPAARGPSPPSCGGGPGPRVGQDGAMETPARLRAV